MDGWMMLHLQGAIDILHTIQIERNYLVLVILVEEIVGLHNPR